MNTLDIDWTSFKNYVDKHSLSIQELPIDNGYILIAYRNPLTLSCQVNSGTSSHTDYESNYQAAANEKVNSEVEIREEVKRTGGHYQAHGYQFDVAISDTTKTINISYPMPISLLAAEWANKNVFEGDEIEFVVGEHTTVGTLTADAAISDTILTVSQSAIDNFKIGRKLRLTDGTNTNDCGRVTAIDKTALKITVETGVGNAFSAATPTYVKMTTVMLERSPLGSDGRVQLGESKIGGSHIPAGTVLTGRYYNNTSTAKKLTFFLEYLY